MSKGKRCFPIFLRSCAHSTMLHLEASSFPKFLSHQRKPFSSMLKLLGLLADMSQTLRGQHIDISIRVSYRRPSTAMDQWRVQVNIAQSCECHPWKGPVFVCILYCTKLRHKGQPFLKMLSSAKLRKASRSLLEECSFESLANLLVVPLIEMNTCKATL